jgi:hypothetical protein
VKTIRLRAALVCALSWGAGACVSIHSPPFMQPTSKREWPATLSLAQFRVSEGKFDEADSVLVQFDRLYPKSPEAIESRYWRALVRMDPSNPRASVAGAMASLDAYVADPRAKEHLRDAAAIRRVAAQLDTLNKMVLASQSGAITTTGRSQASDLRVDVTRPVADPSPSDLEIKRLKDELAKATAELERIRKRLAQPPRNP